LRYCGRLAARWIRSTARYWERFRAAICRRWGSGCTRQWNSGVQRPTDASCADGEWCGIGEPYLRADALALKELTAADAQGGFTGAEDVPSYAETRADVAVVIGD